MAIVIDLNGPDGNAFSLLGTAKNLARQLAPYNDRYKDFGKISAEMTAGDYDNLVKVFMSYFEDVVELIPVDTDEDEDYEDTEEEYYRELDSHEDDMTDAEADADTLRSAGWGTDEDYGYYGSDDDF